MAPTRPPQLIRVSKRRQPLRQSTKPLAETNVERFWRERAAARRLDEERFGQDRITNTDRFWSDRRRNHAHPRTRARTQSESSIRRPLPTTYKVEDARRKIDLHKVVATNITRACRVVKSHVGRGWRGIQRTSWKQSILVAIGLFLVASCVVHVQPTSRGPGPRHFPTFPTYMYSDAHNILGLERPPFGLAAPLPVIEEGWRWYKKVFHTDHWKLNRFPNEKVAHQAYMLGFNAHASATEVYKNPYCIDQTSALSNFQARHDEVGIPRFARNCTCTQWRSWAGTTMPWLFRGNIPNDSTDLSKICPCSVATTPALQNGRAVKIDLEPPPLRRIYDATSWNTLSLRVLRWKVKTLHNGTQKDWNQTDDVKRQWEEGGWAVPRDWLNGDWERGCSDVPDYEIKWPEDLYAPKTDPYEQADDPTDQCEEADS